MHLLIGLVCVYDRNGFQPMLAHDGAFAQDRHVVGFSHEPEQQVDGVHLHLYLIVIVVVGDGVTEGIASLGASSRQGEVVSLQFLQCD